ncbi:MAG TPA: trimeric intracellular cation channel family protein [Homoserinimonas sp.]|nr:trimeric intracellular cation channel family protein [Homoserinimonas sp.]
MDPAVENLGDVIRIVDLAGVLGNAILGGIAARGARLDLVGFGILAILSGLGGGIIRDTLLQSGVPVALTDPYYLILAIAGAVIAFVLPLQGKWTQRPLVLVDALAVGCWSAVGVQKALDAGLGWLPAIILGMITAVGGGMVRDVLLMRVPSIFGGNTLYATSSLVACVVTLVFSELGQFELGALVAIFTGAALSLLARRYGWVLPTQVRIPRPRWRSGKRQRRPSGR